jgi:hypothetical protein
MPVLANSGALGNWPMSLAILLGGWVAVSIILSPLIGRFLAGPDKRQTSPRQTAGRSGVSTLTRPRQVEAVRRNVAIQLYRRNAGWPRVG